MSDRPWKCPVCQHWIHNFEGGYPVASSPDPKFFSNEYPRVCTTCFQLGNIVDTTYWRGLHWAWKEQQRGSN